MLRGMIVLVVDDEPVTTLVLQTFLEEAGHEVVGPAFSAAEARGMAAWRPIDLALVDIDLGAGEDGISLARALREERGIPSLLLTGHVQAALDNRDVAIGLLRKPCMPHRAVACAEAAFAQLRGLTRRIPPELEWFG